MSRTTEEGSTLVKDPAGMVWELLPFNQGGTVPFRSVHYFTKMDSAIDAIKSGAFKMYLRHGQLDFQKWRVHMYEKGERVTAMPGGMCILIRPALQDIGTNEWGEVCP